MQILKNGCDVVRRRDAADEPGSNILYTLKFCQIFVGESIEKRIARVKPRRDKSMNQTSGSVIIKVLTNFTYLPDGHKSCFTNMVNMFSHIQGRIHENSKVFCCWRRGDSALPNLEGRR